MKIISVNKGYFVLLISITLCGCGYIVDGYDQDVTINTTPSAATVYLSNGQKCIAPCSISIEKSSVITYKIEKEGCKTLSGQFLLRPTSGNQGFFQKNSLYGAIDYEMGTSLEIYPNPLNIKLFCNELKKDNL